MQFKDLEGLKKVFLYAGDLAWWSRMHKPFVGLSLHQNNDSHIKHNIENSMGLPDGSVDIYQSEDVMEHIEYKALPQIINEVYRVLRAGGLFRMSMPDYRCDILRDRSRKNKNGEIIFDEGGGGRYDEKTGSVVEGGHLWFPVYESVKDLISKTNFSNVHFLHYYTTEGTPVCKDIDYKLGYVGRTPDNDTRVQTPRRPMSIVLDCYKDD